VCSKIINYRPIILPKVGYQSDRQYNCMLMVDLNKRIAKGHFQDCFIERRAVLFVL
jgi:hypothetical protein